MSDTTRIDSNWRAGLLAYAPIVLWIGVIFFLSSGSGSMEETSRFIGPLLRFLFPSSPEETIQFYHACIRKTAHFTEYGILALLASRAFITSSFNYMRTRWFLIATVLVILIASIDEFNQSFESSRTSSQYDVLLDTFGGACAVGVVYLWRRFRKSRIDLKSPPRPDGSIPG